jgi:DNA-binding MarR family transcriptional regulator
MTIHPMENLGLKQLTKIDPLIHVPSRLTILTYLFVVDSIDFVLLKRVTEFSWGNLSTHLSKLEEAGYVTMEKTFQDKKPHTLIYLSDQGREAFRKYKENLQKVLNSLPD